MKTVMKKLLCLMLVAMMLVSAVPFQAAAAEGDPCRIKLSPWSGSEDLSANAVYVTVAEGSTIVAANVREWADNEKWQDLGYEFKSCLLGDNGTIAMPDTTIPVEVNVNKPTTPEDPEKNPNQGTTQEPVIGDLIIHIMTKYENSGYKDAGTITLSGQSSYTLNKSLAEQVVGKQLVDYKWQPISGTVDMTKGDVEVNLLATIMETKNDKNVYQLRVMFNRGNGNDDYKQIDIYEGEGILEAIQNAGIKPTYENHVMDGYINNHTGTANSYLTIYDVASASMANEQGVIKVFADWREVTDDDDEDFEYGEGGGLFGDANEDPIYDVVLMIYTNGKTSSVAKKFSASAMGAYTKDGKLTRVEVKLVVDRNFKTSSSTRYYGLFTTKTWDKGDYDMDYAVSSIELDPDNTTTVYVMVKNATAYAADSTNPKTGDMIFVPMAVMATAAAAAFVLLANKKRLVK